MTSKKEMKLLSNANAIFFDFDGVIKDSVEIKSNIFGKLFKDFGVDLVQKVKTHNDNNGGMSRYEKIPMYMEWAGIAPNNEVLNKYLEEFSTLTMKKVIDSEWIPGVLPYLKKNYNRQLFFILTATPQEDIEIITSELKIKDLFIDIIGSPTKKSKALQQLLNENSIRASTAVMIGDSYEDYDAAKFNSVPFVLKKNIQNKNLQKNYNLTMIENFNDEQI